MSRIAYCREQARLCRDAASQVGLAKDAARLREMAATYKAEAQVLEDAGDQSGKQPAEQQRQQE